MRMFNHENLARVEDWPTKGFLAGQSLLDEDAFHQISKFDFSTCTSPSFGYGGRKTKQFMPGGPTPKDPASRVLQDLVEELNDVDLFGELVSRSLSGVDECIWAKDVDFAKSIFMSPLLLVGVDSQAYYLGPHKDQSPATQIYLGPEGVDVGTMFHPHDDLDSYKRLPFIPNSGYFQVNSKYAMHSASGTKGVLRKTLMIFWLLNPPENFDF